MTAHAVGRSYSDDGIVAVIAIPSLRALAAATVLASVALGVMALRVVALGMMTLGMVALGMTATTARIEAAGGDAFFESFDFQG